MVENKAYMYGLSAVLLWSTVATAFKLSLRYLTPVQLLFFATLSSLIVIIFILWYQKKWQLLFVLTKKEIFAMLFLGTINPFTYYLVLFKAYDLLPAQEAQALNYTWALTLTYLSVIFLKHSLRWQDIVAGLICYGGVLVISTHGDVLSLKFSNSFGVVLALFSTVLWALFWIYNTKWGIEPIVGLFLNFSSGFVLIFGWFLYVSYGESLPWQGIVGAVYVGFFEMGITFFLWLKALRLTTQTAKIANLIFLSPFISLLLIGYFLNEPILPSTVFGLVLIVSGLLLQSWGKNG